jgi:dipeptidyl aminopeptidase/acylaminoacyl peptidase
MTVQRPFVQDDVFRTAHVMEGCLSHGGDFAVYQLRTTIAALGDAQERSEDALWRIDIKGGTPVLLDCGQGDARSPRLGNGQSLFYLGSESGGPSQLRCLDLDTGRHSTLTEFDAGIVSYAVSPDGKWIAMAVPAPGAKAPVEHVRIIRRLYRCDALPGYIQDIGQALYLMPTDGGDARRLTDHDGIIADIVWAPGGAELAVLVAARESHGDYLTLGTLIRELLVLDLHGNCRSLVANDWIEELFWALDGQQLGFVALPHGDFSRQFQLWMVDRTGGPRVQRSSELATVPGNNVQLNNPTIYSKSNAFVRARTGNVVLAGSVGARTLPWEFDLSGRQSARPLTEGDRTCRIFDLRGDQLLISSQTFTHPTTLCVIDLETGGERLLWDPNMEVMQAIAPPQIEHLIVPNSEAIPIEGWLFRPPHLKPPYETVLYIHGGPFMTFGHSYQEDFLELVGAGYAVAFANPRGSTGYGDAFSTPIVGRWGELELDDFTRFLDALVSRGLADPDRLAVMGYSGGGFLSAWLIGHSDRFRAAIPEQGIYNMASAHGASDASGYFEFLMGGAPHERPERYWSQSPLAYAHRVTTPTLLIQGEDDLRCPMEQAEQYYTALRRGGCEAELLRLSNCYHSAHVAGSPSVRRTRMNAVKNWLDRHLHGEGERLQSEPGDDWRQHEAGAESGRGVA